MNFALLEDIFFKKNIVMKNYLAKVYQNIKMKNGDMV